MRNNKIIVAICIFLILAIIFYFYKDYSMQEVIISKDSCITSDKEITISMKTKKGYKIYYTLDGSIPNKKSNRYKKPIKLNRYSSPEQLSRDENKELMINTGIGTSKDIPRGTVLRVRAIAPNGALGPIEDRTYFIGVDEMDYYNNIIVLSLITDPSNLLDYDKGILVKGKVYDKWSKSKDANNVFQLDMKYEIEGNFTQKGREWEREAVLELFDNNKKLRENVGIRVKGNYTRFYSQKSFNIYFRREYGTEKLVYDLFPDYKDIDGNKISNYKRLSLRNGGNDTEFLKYKDQLLQDLVRDRKVDTQPGRPALLFINGEYWGIYNLQEKYSDTYYSNHYHVDKDNVIMIKEEKVEEGREEDIELYNELMDYAYKDLSNEEIYNEFKEKVDIDSMLDYFAIEIYIGNCDWGGEGGRLKNTLLWRVREPDGTLYGDGKWRWSLYDLEYSSTLYGQEKTNVNYNTIEHALLRQPLFSSAMKNSEFRDLFYSTLKDIGMNNFNYERVSNYMDNYEKIWEPYLVDYYKRFGDNSFQRENSFIATRYYFDKRFDIITNY